MAALTFNPELLSWEEAWREAIKTDGPTMIEVDDTPVLVLVAREAVGQAQEQVLEEHPLISLVPAGDGHSINSLNRPDSLDNLAHLDNPSTLDSRSDSLDTTPPTDSTTLPITASPYSPSTFRTTPSVLPHSTDPALYPNTSTATTSSWPSIR